MTDQLNFFVDADGTQFPIGVRLNKQGDRIGMWYLDKGKRVVLNEHNLIHIRTLPKKGTSPKCMVWSYREFSHSWQVEIEALGKHVSRVCYGATLDEVKRKFLFNISAEWRIEVRDLTRFVNNHPTNFKATRIS